MMRSNSRKARRLLPMAAIFSLPIVWGTTFAIVQRALGDVTPMAFVVIRFGLAGAFFLVISKPARRGAKLLLIAQTPHERRFRRDMIILGLAIGAGYIFQTIGLLTTTSAKSAFLTSTTVIWTPLLAWAMGRERLTPQLLVAVLATVAGIFFLTQPLRAEGFLIGDGLSLACALAFGVYIIVIDRAMLRAKEFAADEHEASIMVTSTQIIAGTIIFLICMPLIEVPRFHATTFSVGSLVYTGIIATCMTGYLQSRYQHHVTPTTASIIYMLEPVVAAAIAEIFLTERMGFLEMLGGGLIIIGVIIAQVKLPNTRGSTKS
ncbi:MAG: DMT family transporter [Bacteroidota bacterium]|nr:DMT family transporter [Bacteroidota bacterium]MDP4233025.1 DMT family transporter [Bacteroidota bacterium]MDP4241830.1 DMT family transporter [Bacteroidota bacterium]MDP4288379.1 DMT family transporter [Bacteroidota bacterium]